MKTRTSAASVVTALAVSLLLMLAGIGCAAAQQEAARVTHLAGTLSAQKADGQKRLLGVDSTVGAGEVLTTEQGTYARLKFSDGAEVVMRPNSQLKIDDYQFNQAKPEEGSLVLSMLRGGLRAITGLIGKKRPQNVRVATPTATIGIRGTHLGALLCQGDCGGLVSPGGQSLANGLHVDVADGAITVSNRAGQITLGAGQFGFVANANSQPVVVPPQAGFRMDIPGAISRNRGAGRSIGANRDAECVAQ